MKRGPNNQILIEDEGIRLLQWLQELHDSGLTITEASKIIQLKAYEKDSARGSESERFAQNTAKRSDRGQAMIASRPRSRASAGFVAEGSQLESELEAVRFELVALRERITRLEGLIGTQHVSRETKLWWETVEEV
ncbi:hypothetical protein JW848_06520 [Candidatus Bipolaricaulota bacterium]|nr:hypothetical protein [Candidatus Bipolaricaulota bacterium]